MSGRIPVGRAIVVTGVITALGYGIMACGSFFLPHTLPARSPTSPRTSSNSFPPPWPPPSSRTKIRVRSRADRVSNPTVTTPSEQQFYDSLAPDLKKKVDDSRAFQAAARAKADQLELLNVSSSSGPARVIRTVWKRTRDRTFILQGLILSMPSRKLPLQECQFGPPMRLPKSETSFSRCPW